MGVEGGELRLKEKQSIFLKQECSRIYKAVGVGYQHAGVNIHMKITLRQQRVMWRTF